MLVSVALAHDRSPSPQSVLPGALCLLVSLQSGAFSPGGPTPAFSGPSVRQLPLAAKAPYLQLQWKLLEKEVLLSMGRRVREGFLRRCEESKLLTLSQESPALS